MSSAVSNSKLGGELNHNTPQLVSIAFLFQQFLSFSAQHLSVVTGQWVCGWTWRLHGLFANRSFNNV